MRFQPSFTNTIKKAPGSGGLFHLPKIQQQGRTDLHFRFLSSLGLTPMQRR